MKKIILASTSPRRKELLSKLGLEYEIMSPNYEEDMTLDLPIQELAKYLSKGKAEVVANNLKEEANSIIIAADTFIALENEILGKPHTEEIAKQTLRKISGKTLSVITGFTIIDMDNNKQVSKAVETKVFIKKLSDSEINNYVATKEPLDKAWAFAIQELWAVIVEKIEGDFTNVIWLPLFELSNTLKEFWIEVI
jgi:septum formation protein